MSEMLERVKKAIVDSTGDMLLPISPHYAEKYARAAIAELREPTMEMLDAAKPHMDSWSSNIAWWQKMIDEALK
jgi:hypothetical protein